VSYIAFCALHLDGVRQRLWVFDQAQQRRQWVRDWERERARLWAVVEARMNFSPSIARDIREWRTEE
jgi:hypothetical protein